MVAGRLLVSSEKRKHEPNQWLINILLSIAVVIGFLLAPMNTAHSQDVVQVLTPVVPSAKVLWIRKLETCEDPSGDPSAKILDVNDKYSYGVLQFQMATWLSFGKSFGATTENISDVALQETVAQSMLDKGGWKNWYHCAKKTKALIGEYPN